MKITRPMSFVLLALLSISAGCAAPGQTVSNFDPIDALSTSVPGNIATELTATSASVGGSLFKEDTDVLSNEQLLQVLNQQIEYPDKLKLVVVRYGRLPYWWGWSETFMHANEQIDEQLLKTLGSSTRVGNVSYLPSMVLPLQMTIPRLRQAAARCQADLLLIYRTDTRTYDREKFFGADETRAYCTVEAILLDTRTGLIPFSTTATQTFSARKSGNDVDFSETVAKASQQAISKAWMQMADAVCGYFNSVPAVKVVADR